MGKKTVAGEEVWQNTMAGRFHYFTTDQNGKRRRMVARGGQLIRITPHDRELISDEIALERRNPFLNGRLKRVDNQILTEDTPDEEAEGKTPLPEGHQAELANTEADLREIFAKNGMAFQTAVKKLDERNIRQLKALSESESVEVTVKQAEFLKKHIDENFKLGGATSSGKEILSEPSGS